MVGYLLLITDPNKEHSIYLALNKIKEIIDINCLYGEWSLICKIQANNRDEIQQIVEEKVKTIPGILNTKTLLGFP